MSDQDFEESCERDKDEPENEPEIEDTSDEEALPSTPPKAKSPDGSESYSTVDDVKESSKDLTELLHYIEEKRLEQLEIKDVGGDVVSFLPTAGLGVSTELFDNSLTLRRCKNELIFSNEDIPIDTFAECVVLSQIDPCIQPVIVEDFTKLIDNLEVIIFGCIEGGPCVKTMWKRTSFPANILTYETGESPVILTAKDVKNYLHPHTTDEQEQYGVRETNFSTQTSDTPVLPGLEHIVNLFNGVNISPQNTRELIQIMDANLCSRLNTFDTTCLGHLATCQRKYLHTEICKTCVDVNCWIKTSFLVSTIR